MDQHVEMKCRQQLERAPGSGKHQDCSAFHSCIPANMMRQSRFSQGDAPGSAHCLLNPFNCLLTSHKKLLFEKRRLLMLFATSVLYKLDVGAFMCSSPIDLATICQEQLPDRQARHELKHC